MTTAIFAYGDPDVLEAIDAEGPRPGAGQVRRDDFRRRVPVNFPQTLDNEFAGVVVW